MHRHRLPILLCIFAILVAHSLRALCAALALAAQQASKEGHEGATPEEGPWLFTLDFPSYMPVMTHAKNRCKHLHGLGCPTLHLCACGTAGAAATARSRASPDPLVVLPSPPSRLTAVLQGAARGDVPCIYHPRLLWRH